MRCSPYWQTVASIPLVAVGQQPASSAVTLPDGTIVPITLSEELNSGKSHQNDPVHAEIAEDVKVAGVIVIAKGASVVGHVITAAPKGSWGHSSELSYSLDYAKAVDGSNVRLRASSSQGGGDSKAAMMLGLSGAFKHGKDIDIPKGTSISAYIDGDHTVMLKANSR